MAFICYNNSNNDKLLTFGPFWFSEKQEQNKIDMVDEYQKQTKQERQEKGLETIPKNIFFGYIFHVPRNMTVGE